MRLIECNDTTWTLFRILVNVNQLKSQNLSHQNILVTPFFLKYGWIVIKLWYTVLLHNYSRWPSTTRFFFCETHKQYKYCAILSWSYQVLSSSSFVLKNYFSWKTLIWEYLYWLLNTNIYINKNMTNYNMNYDKKPNSHPTKLFKKVWLLHTITHYYT